MLLPVLHVHSQMLPGYQPEQDACGAINLCSTSFYTPYTYQGAGVIRLDITGRALGEYYERNLVWFRVRTATAGNLVFSIAPVNPAEDYDFTVIDATHLQCPYNSDDLGKAIVRYNLNCNGNCNRGVPLYPDGKIGLNYTSTKDSVPQSTAGDPFLRYLAVQPNEEYLIMINNFSGSAAGFRIDFDGSTTTLKSEALAIDSVRAVCNAGANYKTLSVDFNQPILCNSVAADGSDFTLGPGAPAIISAKGANCSSSQGAYVHELTLTLDASLKLGETYRLTSKKGGDGNTTSGVCFGSDIQEGYTKEFSIALPYKINAGRDTALCVGGSVQLNVSLQGQGDVRIRWQPSTGLSSNSVVNPIANPSQDMEYVVTAAAVGFPAVCHHRDTIRVKVLKGFNIVSGDSLLCKPSLVPIRLQGDPEFSYSWSPPDYLSGTDGMQQTAFPQKEISYTVTASYPGCKDSSQSINIAMRQWPKLLTADTVLCGKQSVLLRVTGGSGYQHLWQPDTYLNNAMAVSPISKPDTSIRYSFTSRYPGCADSVQLVNIAVEPRPEVLLDSMAACFGTVVQLKARVQPTWYKPYRYLWNGPGIDGSMASNPSYFFKQNSNLGVSVSTENGCTSTTAAHFTAIQPPKLSAGPDLVAIAGVPLQLKGMVDSTAAVYQWRPGFYLDNQGQLITKGVFNSVGQYVYILTAANSQGCSASDTLQIRVLANLSIPNAFSPNADGINDVWNIAGLQAFPNSKTTVFTRWGQQVFDGRGYSRPWDGKLKGKTVPVGIYYYVIEINDGGYGNITGSLTVLQ